jgi:hypothetical protein
VQRGETPNPHAVREAILKSALPCQYADSENEPKCLAGVLNISGAIKQLRDFQKINYSFSRIIIILGVWEVGIDGCPLLPIL